MSQEKIEQYKLKFAEINFLCIGVKKQLEQILTQPEEHICPKESGDESEGSANANDKLVVATGIAHVLQDLQGNTTPA